MSTTTERVKSITAYVADGCLDGDEIASDEEYAAYCDEWQAALEAAFPGASAYAVRVEPNTNLHPRVELENESHDFEAYERWTALCARVQEIGEMVFERGGWVR